VMSHEVGEESGVNLQLEEPEHPHSPMMSDFRCSVVCLLVLRVVFLMMFRSIEFVGGGMSVSYIDRDLGAYIYEYTF